jgi:hypothetical protein
MSVHRLQLACSGRQLNPLLSSSPLISRLALFPDNRYNTPVFDHVVRLKTDTIRGKEPLPSTTDAVENNLSSEILCQNTAGFFIKIYNRIQKRVFRKAGLQDD